MILMDRERVKRANEPKCVGLSILASYDPAKTLAVVNTVSGIQL